MKKCYNIQYNIKTSNQAVASWRQEQGEINYNKKADKGFSLADGAKGAAKKKNTLL